MLIQITIPQYPRRIKVSENIRPIYFEMDEEGIIRDKKGKIHKKYLLDPERVTAKFGKASLIDFKNTYALGFYIGNKLHGYFKHHALINFLDEEKCKFKIPQKYIPLLPGEFIGLELLTETQLKGKVHLRLISLFDMKPIISNEKKVGTPSYQVISGQNFYSGMHHAIRSKIINKIKNYYLPYIKDIPIIPKSNYPVRIKMYVFDTPENIIGEQKSNNLKWDIGNRSFPYGKSILDLLTTGETGDLEKDGLTRKKYFEPKLIDDSIKYVTEDPSGGVFCPIENTKDRKLVLIIGKDDIEYQGQISRFEIERNRLIEKFKEKYLSYEK